MSLMSEFKTFAIKGNMIDMAVGIVIGAAFGKIVSSLVDNVIMPPIGLLIGGVDFSNLKLILKDATATTEAVSLNYGLFLQTLVDFTIIAFSIFMVVKTLNRLKASLEKKQEQQAAAPAIPSAEVQLLTEIRDLLQTRAS